jgi:hypothetical protein
MTISRNLSFLAEGVSSTGVLGVSNGGTGLTSLTTGYIPYGNGTSAFNNTSVFQYNSFGNLLIGTSSDYSVGTTNNVMASNGFVWANNNTGNSSNRNWSANVNQYAAGSWNLTSSSANNNWPNDAYRFAVTIAGSCYNTTGVYGVLSDINFKENIEDARSYTDDLLKIRLVKYSLKEEASNKPTKLGVIAQEIEKIFPGFIEVGTTPKGEEFKSVKMSLLIPMMLKTIQEQQASIEKIKQKVGL